MDRQRRKQAEFLVYHSCPLKLVTGIGVYNDAARARVEAEVAANGMTAVLPVEVHPEWYYE
jgi:ssDNA thymidine ADP-ribosyltransferase, DarT